MAQPFDIDDLVWAKFLTYRPWPGRIIRQTIALKEGKLCVQFYGNDDHSQVAETNIFPYLDRVEDFTLNLPKDRDSIFYTAINTIHEKYWNLVDLKRNSEDTGFPVDTDEEIEMAIEDRKAGRWNPPVLRHPLPRNEDDDDADSSEDDYPNTSGGKSKYKRLKKDKKGADTKQKGSATKTKNSKKTGSKTVTSQPSTSGQATKASTSGQSSKASTSGLKRKASTSSQDSKVSNSGKTSKILISSPRGKTSSRAKAKSSPSKATRSSVSLPITKKQLVIRLTRLSAEEIARQTAPASTSKVNTRKRKSSESVCPSKEEITSRISEASTSKVNTRKRKSGEIVSPSKAEITSQISEASTSKVITIKRKSGEIVCPSKVVKLSTSEACSSSSSSQESKAPQPQIRSSPFMHLTLKVCPTNKITVPQNSCTECTIRFGFIGLKRLSQILIYSLLKEGHIVNVWSKDASEFNALTNAGAKRTNTPAGIIISSDVIFYSTKDPDISKNILLTREGVFDGCARSLGIPKIFVELTNIDVVEPERSIRPLISYQGGYYLQMKAMIPQMKEDKPIFICAGNERVYAAVVSCLYHITRDIHYFGTEFFKDAPLKLTSKITEELVLQSLQKTTSFLYELGFDVSEFEKTLCHKDFDFGKVAAKLKENNEAKRNEKIEFYQNM